jgi:hypothetical protein
MPLVALLENIINEERIRPFKNADQTALFSQKRKRNESDDKNENKRKKSAKCTVCKQPGHLAKDCWFRTKNKTSKTCEFCKKTGHTLEECWSKTKKVTNDLAAVSLVVNS